MCFSIYFDSLCYRFGSHPYSVGSSVLSESIHSSGWLFKIGVLRRNSMCLLRVWLLCVWIRVGAFAHQKSLCRLNYTQIDCVVSSSCIGCLRALPLSFSVCIAIYLSIVASLTHSRTLFLFLVLLVSLLCNLSSFIHYSQVRWFASQSIDIWYHHQGKNTHTHNSPSKGFLYFCRYSCWHSHFLA